MRNKVNHFLKQTLTDPWFWGIVIAFILIGLFVENNGPPEFVEAWWDTTFRPNA